MNHATVTATDNGPYANEGSARVIDADGNEYDVTGQKTVFLCRCGGSVTKPFCDGTHETVNFEAIQSRVAHFGPKSPSNPEREATCSTNTCTSSP